MKQPFNEGDCVRILDESSPHFMSWAIVYSDWPEQQACVLDTLDGNMNSFEYSEIENLNISAMEYLHRQIRK